MMPAVRACFVDVGVMYCNTVLAEYPPQKVLRFTFEYPNNVNPGQKRVGTPYTCL